MPGMKIQKSSEDYLESMLILHEEKGYVRSIDIAKHLRVTKPSVSYATKKLRENGYITMRSDGIIELTNKGYEIASKTYDKHKMLTKFFRCIGVPRDIAQSDACKIEHDISAETYAALCEHVDNFLSDRPKNINDF